MDFDIIKYFKLDDIMQNEDKPNELNEASPILYIICEDGV